MKGMWWSQDWESVGPHFALSWWGDRAAWPDTVPKQCSKAFKKLLDSPGQCLPAWGRSTIKEDILEEARIMVVLIAGNLLEGLNLRTSQCPKGKWPLEGDCAVGWMRRWRELAFLGLSLALSLTHWVILGHHLSSLKLSFLVAKWKDYIKERLSNLYFQSKDNIYCFWRTAFQATLLKAFQYIKQIQLEEIYIKEGEGLYELHHPPRLFIHLGTPQGIFAELRTA